jgi:hypothetical protein
MIQKKCSVVCLGLTLASLGVVAAIAGDPEGKSGKRDRHAPKEITLVGRIVDLQGFMSDKYASEDRAKSTADNLKAGVPAAIESAIGLVVIGQGNAGAAKTLAPFAYRRTQVTGKLYEKNGLKYLDLAAAELEPQPEDDEPSEE